MKLATKKIISAIDMTSGAKCMLLLALLCAPSCIAQRIPTGAEAFYGNVGDPYTTEGGKASCKKMLNDCGKKLIQGDYCLANDVTAASSLSGECFAFSKGVHLDLKGHTIFGRLYSNEDAQGAHIFNGRISCQVADHGADAGCVTINSSDAPALSEPTELHHLTIHNSAENVVTRAIFVDWSPQSQSPRFGLRIYNTTIVSAPCPLETSCNRTNDVRVQSATLSLEAFHNDWTCSADTNACQGIELFATRNSRIHHNRLDMKEAQMPETGRAIVCDGDRVPGSDQCEVDSNYIIANNNRAIRVRSSTNVHIHHNYIANCSNTTSGCVHVYDQTSVPEDYGELIIEQNTIEMNGGTAVYLRCGKGALIRDNVVKTKPEKELSGSFAFVTSWGEGCTTDATFLRNGTVAVPNIRIVSNPPASARAIVCRSGKVTGSGSLKEKPDCP
jgi:hypothetical protein